MTQQTCETTIQKTFKWQFFFRKITKIAQRLWVLPSETQTKFRFGFKALPPLRKILVASLSKVYFMNWMDYPNETFYLYCDGQVTVMRNRSWSHSSKAGGMLSFPLASLPWFATFCLCSKLIKMRRHGHTTKWMVLLFKKPVGFHEFDHVRFIMIH